MHTDGCREPLQPGYIISGKYCVRKYIASGGTGLTYLVTENGYPFIFKEFFPFREASIGALYRNKEGNIMVRNLCDCDYLRSKYRKRLSREIEISKQARFDSENNSIKECFFEMSDLSEECSDNRFMIAARIQTIDGRSLEQLCEEESSKFDIKKRLHIFRRIVKAVDVMHKMGIIHLDLKPSNIYVPEDKEIGIVYILDFGSAIVLGDEMMEDSLLSYSHGFSAPEVRRFYLRDNCDLINTLSIKADYYSLGAILYWLIYDKVYEYTDDYMENIVNRLEDLSKDYPDLVSIKDEIIRLVSKLMITLPRFRADSDEEIYREIEEITDILDGKMNPNTMENKLREIYMGWEDEIDNRLFGIIKQ